MISQSHAFGSSHNVFNDDFKSAKEKQNGHTIDLGTYVLLVHITLRRLQNPLFLEYELYPKNTKWQILKHFWRVTKSKYFAQLYHFRNISYLLLAFSTTLAIMGIWSWLPYNIFWMSVIWFFSARFWVTEYLLKVKKPISIKTSARIAWFQYFSIIKMLI